MIKITTILFLSLTTLTFSQNLHDGSILFTSVQSDGDKTFSFVAMEEILGHQQISFTDKPLDSLGDFIGSEGTITWEAPDSGVSIGEVVVIIDTAQVSTNKGTIVGVTGNFNLASAGDQLIAFESFDEAILIEVLFVSALNFGTGTSWVSSGVPNSNQSYIPIGLTSIVSFNSHVDNGLFNCPFELLTLSDLRSSVLDIQNWSTSQDIIGNNCDFIAVTDVVGLSDSLEGYVFSIYPNPLIGSVLFFDHELTGIKIVNSMGRIVLMENKAKSVSVAGFAQGLYFLSSDQGIDKFRID